MPENPESNPKENATTHIDARVVIEGDNPGDAAALKVENNYGTINVHELAPGEDPFDKANDPIFHPGHQRNTYFTGREEILQSIASGLADRGRAVLSGLGGVGKSQIALEYAFRHQDEYRLVFWLTASSELDILSAYRSLAILMGLPEHKERDLGVIASAVIRKLSANTGWLLVFDNADDSEGIDIVSTIAPLLPHGGHVIITSRRSKGWNPIASPIDVGQMARDESVAFLMRRSGQSDEEQADALARALGDLPLALEQAAAYIDADDGETTFERYLQRIGDNLALFDEDDARAHAYEKTINTTWTLSMQRIETKHPAARALLSLCAVLAPEGIPGAFFRALAHHAPGEWKEKLTGEEEIGRARRQLTRYSLLKSEGGSMYSIHRLLQRVIRHSMKEKWQEVAVGLVSGMYPGWEFEHWGELEVLLPHAQALLEKETLESEEEAWLANRFGYYLKNRGRYREAEPMYIKALELTKQMLGIENPDTLSSMNNLASLYYATGRFEEAEPLFERTLELRQKFLGAKHPRTLTTMNNLAGNYMESGKYQEASALF